jgi:hypothetical protein
MSRIHPTFDDDLRGLEGVYVSESTVSHCKICDTLDDLREGACWVCAEAESIIAEGVDMYDKGLDSDNQDSFRGNKGYPARTSMEKLELLRQKGWRYTKP